MSKTKVLIVGGRKLLREGIDLLLRRHEDVCVVGEASAAESGAKLIVPLDVDVAVLALSAAGQSGSEVVGLLRAKRRKLGVVVLALTASRSGLRTLLGAGTAACLSKECSSDELVAAIRAAAAGRTYLNEQLLDAVVTGYAKPDKTAPPPTALAPREREVLRRLARGLNTKQIARELKVSTKTVETHRRRVMDKLRLYSVAELTTYALREELVTADEGSP